MPTWHIESTTAKTSHIILRRGILGELNLEEWAPAGTPVFVIADPIVLAKHLNLEKRLVQWAGRDSIYHLDISEPTKNLTTVENLYREFGARHVRRDTVVVAVGGGVLTDTVGYAAATYLRGIKWIAIPTTLLGQVDAAIGGKVAVNVAWGKNLVGAFHLPQAVIIDPHVLYTLPIRQWRTGVGEVIKSALIDGQWLWERLNHAVPALGSEEWDSLVEATAAIKIAIVNNDLEETASRMYLNFGHTVAHGLENYLGYGRITHGEAVAMGTRIALALSEDVLGLDEAVRRTVERWMVEWELPLTIPLANWSAVWEAMTQDKKSRAHGLQWVLLKKVGQPVIYRNLPQSQVQDTMERILST
jgi:3-dehydroquinate synthase